MALLCDADPAMLAQTADRFPARGGIWPTRTRRSAGDVDACSPATTSTPSSSWSACWPSPAWPRLFLAAGLPALIEKPPGIASADTAQLAELQARHGTVAQVGLNRRFYSSHLAARGAVRPRGRWRRVTVEAHEDLTRMTSASAPRSSRR